ncbi:MAG TPA: phosphotransferase [Novosphingobium sp.]|nr:phosphotransferase [Novosphingobium sp.]
MGEFPAHPDNVEPEWLAGKLRDAGVLSDAAITSLRWEPIGTGQVGDSVRYHVEYDRSDAGPATIAGKFPAADPTSRSTAAAFSLYRKEVGFYRELHPSLEIRVPRPLAAELAENGVDFILLFEDLGPARGGNQLAGCTIEDARVAIVQAAELHAPSWGNAALTGLGWLHSGPEVTSQIKALYPQAQASFRERYDGLLAPELMQTCADLAAASDLWFGRETKVPCLVHGDFRLDNMLFDIKGGAEPIAVLDWQTIQTGSGLTDIGYFLGCGIGSSLRRAHEDELLALYIEEMGRRGVALTRTGIWDLYRIGALHGLSTAVFSAAFVERTVRGDENFLSMARGAAQLALDHDSLDALKGS